MSGKHSSAKNLAVIGGGASGLAAAVFAAKRALELEKKIHITIYEANSRVGKKILVTGNGRCNLSNSAMDSSHYRGSILLVRSVLKRFGSESAAEFFASLGLLTVKDSAGRMYPMNRQASSVFDFLRAECEKLCIDVKTDCKITSVKKHDGCYILNGNFRADAFILSCGGIASPSHNGGDGFFIAKDFNLKVSPVFPALTPLCCKNFPKSLKGVRAQGSITLKSKGRTLCCDMGEIQYTDYGLSGIPAMQVSRFAANELLLGEKNVFAVVDSVPELSENEILHFLKKSAENNPQMPCEQLLSGLLPKKLASFIISECSLNPQKQAGSIHDSVFEKIAYSVKRKKYQITSVKGFEDAQVMAGGIAENEIDERTLELKKLRKAYVCGEIIDVDGECGGYNLHWAWASGFVAGSAAAEEI